MAQRSPSFKFPTRRAVASLALVSVISAIENQRKAQSQQPGEEEFASQDMSGELQTIPARHGVATFVPRGRTIKIINTYGKQVVSTWAFGLHAPPQKGGDDDDDVGEEEAEDIEEKVDALKKGLKEAEDSESKGGDTKEKVNKKDAEKEIDKEIEKPKEDAEKEENKPKTDSQSSDDKAKEGTSSKEQPSQETPNDSEDPPEQAPNAPENQSTDSNKKGGKRTWASYLPSIPYRNKNQGADKSNGKSSPKADAKSEKEKNEATSKAWSSYIPTGKGFSSYVPNVQLPDSQGVVSAFKSSHYRDPNKSYAEQLYDFSKTPVGAGSIAGMSSSRIRPYVC
jgi:hypothetical protein